MTALVGKMHFVDAQTHGFQYKLEFNDWWQFLGPKAQLYANELGFRTPARACRRWMASGSIEAIPGQDFARPMAASARLQSAGLPRWKSRITSTIS